jgi:predicted RNase H-like HicB family nuclease
MKFKLVAPLNSNSRPIRPPLGIVRSMTYKVALRKTNEGFSISCPALPGCWSQGATEDEALENIQSAIREYMDAVVDRFVETDVREVEISV